MTGVNVQPVRVYARLQGVAEGRLTVGDAVLFITLMQVSWQACAPLHEISIPCSQLHGCLDSLEILDVPQPQLMKALQANEGSEAKFTICSLHAAGTHAYMGSID